ncbi:TlpA family protein disulfide reductase [Halorubrum sp. DTA98]|uniref:TlpA family protein disulfide reductase n=1 Tax=Halorubrum sp. DTA98 TaxID=3402163 RepID=UPI003AAF33B3
MNRRTALAAIAGIGVLGGGGYVARRRGTDTLSPTRIETLTAPGSTAGYRLVPEPGSVTVLEFFATWCSTCASYMNALRKTRRVTDAEFVSVTNEPVGVSVDRSDVVDWWREHDGEWTVGLDEELALTTALDASAVPYTVVFDETNAAVYAESGTTSASELVAVVRNA